MKKLFLIPMITIFGLLSCSKEEVAVSKTEQHHLTTPTSTSVTDQLLTVRSEIMKELLTAARDSTFRTLVLNECLQQRYGDYYVRLIDLAQSLEGHSSLDYLRSRLIDYDSEVISITQDRHPVLFYPRAETIEELINQGASTISLQVPIGVFQDVYFEDYSSPGHVLDNNLSLAFHANITEEFA